MVVSSGFEIKKLKPPKFRWLVFFLIAALFLGGVTRELSNRIKATQNRISYTVERTQHEYDNQAFLVEKLAEFERDVVIEEKAQAKSLRYLEHFK